MPRLRRVSSQSPGWSRRRHGKGFRYIDEHGGRLADADVKRIKALVIPPAWRDVWICPAPNGHLQATGVDAAGRRQYLYHPAWRVQRDKLKFDRVETAALKLPTVRRKVSADLALDGMPLERANSLWMIAGRNFDNQPAVDEYLASTDWSMTKKLDRLLREVGTKLDH